MIEPPLSQTAPAEALPAALERAPERATAPADAPADAPSTVVLHVGCGPASADALPPAFFAPGGWRELRLDIDPSVRPDILASITDMSAVPDASIDVVWSSHNLEHLFAHEVGAALAEFHRVLRPGGFALTTMPDLQQIAALVAEGRLEDAAYGSPACPITPLDMLYGHRADFARGNHFMAHRTGFVAATLDAALRQAGFAGVQVTRHGASALWAVATKAG